MLTNEPPIDFARIDLTEAVTVALAREGHLLSAGEELVAKRYLSLPDDAASLYARLQSRRRSVFRLASLSYTEIPDIPAASDELVSQGFAWDERMIPTRMLLETHTVVELKALCKAANLKRGGKRAALLSRLSEAAVRSKATSPSLRLRHRGLFTRLCRLYLCDHSGDLSRMVIARLGTHRYPAYTPTGGAGIFQDRAQLLSYEAALFRRWTLTNEALFEALPVALTGVESRPMPEGHRYRFSARRFDADLAMHAARALERAKQPEEAAAVYRRLIDAGIRDQSHAEWRLSLCLSSLGRFAEGAARCDVAREHAAPAEALTLERTGRRLAKKAGKGWRPMPPVPSPRIRTLPLPASDRPGSRPGYWTPEGPRTIEPAIQSLLSGLGRQALLGESTPWSSLFGLLFYDAIFAPVPGMLPTPLMMQPLDMSSADFAARRRKWMDPVFSAIEDGEAPSLLAAALVRHEGVRLPGVRLDLLPPDALVKLTQAIDGQTLSGILRCFAEDRRHAGRGLPDLCILPGPEVRIPGSIPGRVPACLLLVEIKGPTDSIRDSQRIWLARLCELGVIAEVWKIKRIPPSLG